MKTFIGVIILAKADGMSARRLTGPLRQFWLFICLLSTGFAVSLAAGQQEKGGTPDTSAARNQAQSYFEADQADKAMATLAEAARANPGDRVVGAMHYSGVQNHLWHQPQILPVKHGGPVRALAFNFDGTKLASGSGGRRGPRFNYRAARTSRCGCATNQARRDGPDHWCRVFEEWTAAGRGVEGCARGLGSHGEEVVVFDGLKSEAGLTAFASAARCRLGGDWRGRRRGSHPGFGNFEASGRDDAE